MDPASFGLAVVALAPLVIQSGNLMITTYKSYRNAVPEIEQSVLTLESEWLKLRYQLDFLVRVWKGLDEEFQLHQNKILNVLHSKLEKAILKIKNLTSNSRKKGQFDDGYNGVKMSAMERFKYAVTVKSALASAIKDVRKLGEMFNPSWFLLLRLSNQNFEPNLIEEPSGESDSMKTIKRLRDTIQSIQSSSVQQLEGGSTSSVFVNADVIQHDVGWIPYSSSRTCYLRDTGASVIVDATSQDAGVQTLATLKDVRKIALVLQNIDPSIFGLLNCYGVIKNPSPPWSEESFHFVFNIPQGLYSPQSLRQLLLSGLENTTLNCRLALAKRLCRSCLFIHTTQFVHKNIRPEKILVFHGQDGLFEWPFIVGFEHFRTVDGNTSLVGDDKWERNLYQHPSRQGVHPEEAYSMQHDIYALGVCLLEIGLPESLISYQSPSAADARLLITEKGLREVIEDNNMRDQRSKSIAVKAHLTALAMKKLPNSMGSKYTEVVTSCLSCLDKTGSILGREDEFLDEDGILIGVRYIEKILLAIEEISI